MKKGLSVLLILAALFGFYGGATSLNDVLDCKEYWEEKGKQTTADLNKLEDGINQLKDNEQAYLDGKDTLAEGEKTLADGEAQYAQGLADYEAAPAKLADGRKQLADGEKKLDQAVADKAKLESVKKKIQDVEDAYKPWLKKFNKLRASIVDNPKKPTKGVLYDAGAVAVGLVGNGSTDGILQAFGILKKKAAEASAGAAQYDEGMKKIVAGVKAAIKDATGVDVTDEQAINAIQNDDKFATQKAQYNGAKENYDKYTALAANLDNAYTYLMGTYKDDMVSVATSINNKIEKIKGAEYQATQLRKTDFSGDMNKADTLLNKLATDKTLEAVLKVASEVDPELAGKVSGGIGQVKSLISNSKSSKSDYDKAYDELKPNAKMGKNIGKKVAAASKAILSNKDISKKLTSKQKSALKPYKEKSSITGLPNIELLYGTMTLGKDKKDDGKNSLLDSFRKIKDGATSGLNQYTDGINDGKEDLAAGRAKYEKGLADYKAAPAKLADAEKKLADGRKQLADGKAKLGEYEDGEQQVRDGLATVMGSEANGGLESIFDRRSGDDDFDNGDNHLELDEGLSAVDTARGYQADSGELITEEIMARAIGTGLSLAAAALACLAALLGLLKKYKGAGIAALLAAAAGCVGIYQGVNAGSEFSSIAGSTVGNMPWIAAGVLAGVAALHAITHFTAKKDA